MLVESIVIVAFSFVGAYAAGRFVEKLMIPKAEPFDLSNVPEVETYEICVNDN